MEAITIPDMSDGSPRRTVVEACSFLLVSHWQPGFIFQTFNLIHYLNVFENVSVGQQQRVAIARALIKNPDVIFADEPTGNLDTDTAAEVMELLYALHQQGKTVVIITHDKAMAKTTQRQIAIVNGRVSE
jgi:ABC-type lipoprotein export system ATPase subunit